LVDKEDIMKELAKVIDPEIGIPITEMKLIDNIEINDNEVTIEYHLTMPFCPPVFALAIGQDIKRRVSAIDDVTKVTTVLSGHQMVEDINKKVNSSD
jgi:metal-sulfur cluster biosynthetic enzyme|tara:strand:- start:603 stop:893 length:291 start_codon:yes stop_codon:yes gene_type:complete